MATRCHIWHYMFRFSPCGDLSVIGYHIIHLSWEKQSPHSKPVVIVRRQAQYQDPIVIFESRCSVQV